ncbi:MAG: hypothetical protein Q9166_006366 [cf. Caloplaca sp. 2 TL-2023]
MGASQHDQSLGDQSTPSSPPTFDPPPPSGDPILDHEQDIPEPLSEQESAFLDQSISLLDQEYDYQRQLIDHYSKARHQTTYGYLPNRKPGLDDTNGIGQHLQASKSELYANRKGNPLAPPRMYTGMDDGGTMEKGYQPSNHNAYVYHYSQHRRPLVDLIQNKWRAAAAPPDFFPLSPTAPSFSQIVSAPKFRRYLMIISLILLMPWAIWRWYGKPRWEDHKILDNALNKQLGRGAAWYGLNMRPAFRDMIQLQTWDNSLLTQGGGKKRLVFVGDVHGCYDELTALLAETKYDNRTDHLIFTGDLISKGPASPAVVDFAVQQHASCVRGNHEDRIMLAYRDLNSHLVALPGPDEERDVSNPTPPSPGGPITDSLDDESFSHGDYIDRNFAKSLSTEQASYLASCPAVLDIGHVPGIGHTVAVHAGLIPGVGLEKQDPMGIMSMKTVDLKTHVPSRKSKGMPWFKLWNAYQSILPKRDRSTVIYGHDAKRGLQMNKYTKGLDSGCVEGGKLTTFLVTIENDKQSKQEVVSVKCKDYRGLKGKDKGWDDLPFLQIKEDEHGGAGTGHFK